MTEEAKLQQDTNKWLRERHIKFFHYEKGRYNKSKQHRKGWFDDTIYPGNGYTFFIELKAKKNKLKLTPEQEKFYIEMTNKGYKCYVIDDLEIFKKIVEKEIEGLVI